MLLAAAPAGSGVAAVGGPPTAIAAVALTVLPDLMADEYADQYRNKSFVMGNAGIAGQLLGRSLGREPLDYDQLHDLVIGWFQQKEYFYSHMGQTSVQFEAEILENVGTYGLLVKIFNQAYKLVRKGEITQADFDLWFEQQMIPFMIQECKGDNFKTSFVVGLFVLTLKFRLSSQNLAAIREFVDLDDETTLREMILEGQPITTASYN